MKLSKSIASILAAGIMIACLSAAAGAESSPETSNATTVPPATEESQTVQTTKKPESVPKTTESTTKPITEPAAETSETTTTAVTLPENPFENGMLSDQELYEYIADYLEAGATLNMDGSAVLIDESTINPDNDENQSDEDSETGSENAGNDNSQSDDNTQSGGNSGSKGEKLMYTIATRDGSTFYIIIDKSGSSENVYFLNKVDIIDLASLISYDDEEELSPQEKQIIAAANGISVEQLEKPENTDDGENDNPDNPADDKNNASSGETEKPDTDNTKSGGDDMTMYIIIGVVMVLAIGAGWYFKVGPGKKKKAAFDETETEDEPEFEDEITEDETQEDDANTNSEDEE